MHRWSCHLTIDWDKAFVQTAAYALLFQATSQLVKKAIEWSVKGRVKEKMEIDHATCEFSRNAPLIYLVRSYDGTFLGVRRCVVYN